ncbi:MAG: hypothetical protein SOR72_01095 [Hornefia sp.]|nr:hypothetical protein [Hornefia sp.]
MKNRYYEHSLIILIFVILLCIVFATMLKGVFANNADNQNMDSFIQVQKRCLDLNEKFGDNSMYSQLVTKIDCRKLSGVDDVKAFYSSVQELISDRALQELAKKENVHITKQEVDAYIGDLIRIAKQDEKFPEIMDSCAKQGITFEDTLYKNHKHYYMELLRDKLYNKLMKMYFKDEGQLSLEDIQSLEAKWDSIKNKAISEYKETKDYEIVSSYLLNNKSGTFSSRKNTIALTGDIDYIKY